jgi:hypothetical protein
VTAHPADDAVRAIIGQIRRADWGSIEAATIAALRRDRAGSPSADGYGSRASGSGARGSPEHTSTEAAALSGPRRDEHHELAAAAVAALERAARSCAAATAALQRVDEIAAQPARPFERAACAEHWCEDPADDGRKGRCEACYRYRKRRADELGVSWSEVGPVSRATIEERKAKRDRRRVHVTGPLTGR